MTKNIILSIISFIISLGTGLCAINQGEPGKICSNIPEQDTIKQRQILYNGMVWKNKYRWIDGDQFLFSEFFLPGTISINSKTFKNVRIKYDIFSDEIITPVNNQDILQLNKEMVDSFTVQYEHKTYRFENIRNDTLKGFTGYFNVLYKGRSSFCVKYQKSISSFDTSKSEGQFIQAHKMFLVKDNVIYQIKNKKDLFTDLKAHKEQIRNFIKKNKLRISSESPESYVPVIIFYDSISQ
jgi:hypothetical protein